MNYGNLFIITAPSGTGKSSLIKALLNSDSSISISISHTTRKPRSSEKNGQEYHFITIDEFKKMCNDNVFLEHAEVHGNFYGTSKYFIDKKLETGQDVITEIDWQGSQQIKLQYPDSIRIFILPPSFEEIRKRMIQRAQDTQETINKRLLAAYKEVKYAKDCEYLVINKDFDKALSDLRHIIKATKLRYKTQAIKNLELFTKLGVTNNDINDSIYK
ncbi:guanylate kinase [Candidatus Kinetoplastibacterium desouzaii TCC079E]|uniref:Guanylate kinase n=1 Tax=Candidatus Kinetoplastidibacterium desouzai TCC079E TaxID=1208919 RepID=M1LRS0_9PROT|nr:guanylate kinase [Candidatus Kinetoplastibacterium desouzaii]AGF46836.1 guanylate kinase [Candidatus Kinetoplastibacterium desouzaii TCC079E]